MRPIYLTRTNCIALGAICMALFISPVISGDVLKLRAANISPASISLAWVSDESVSDASVSVYADPAGQFDITSAVTIEVLTESAPDSHSNGLVVVQVSGLDASTQYFFRTQTQSTNGSADFPQAPEFFTATTAQAFAIEDQSMAQQPLANTIFRTQSIDLASSTVLDGVLVFAELGNGAGSTLLGITSASANSIQAETLLDLNNLYDHVGQNISVPADMPVQFVEWRGLNCPGAIDQARHYFGRTPATPVGPAIRRVSLPISCFASNTVCDEEINVLDFQFVLNALGANFNDCEYSIQLDVDQDGAISSNDYLEIINRLGEVAPFGN